MRDIFESALERLLGDLSTPDLVLACEGGHWPAAFWQAIEDTGFAVAAAPEALAGAGAGWEDLYGMLTACGRHNAPVPLPEALQAALALCIRYATERVQFGKPIGSFQAIGHQIAVLAEQVALVSVSAEAACAESGTGGLALLRIASAKVLAAEAATVAVGIAHAVHGAIGCTHEHHLHLTTRRLWAWRSESGSSTVWSQRIGRPVCAGGAASYWPAVTAGVPPATTQGDA